MAHTPGPWLRVGLTVYALTEYTGERKYHRGELIFPDGVNRFSCSVQGGGLAAAPFDEMEANARLIAAAPELLQRLKEIKACLHVALMSFPMDIAKEGMEVVREADAAIAKAEGRT